MEFSIINPCRHRCRSLKSILVNSGIKVVSYYNVSKDFLEAIDGKPQVCLMDVTMADIDGFDLIKVLTKDYPYVRVLVVTAYTHPFTINWMVKYGARGFISLTATDEEIAAAVQNVSQGFHYSDLAPQSLFNDIKKRKVIVAKIYGRQKELLRCFALGMSDRDIEKKMKITKETICDYSTRLLKKISNGNERRRRALFVSFALQAGLINNINKNG